MFFAFFCDSFAWSIGILFCMAGSFCILKLHNFTKYFQTIITYFVFEFGHRFCLFYKKCMFLWISLCFCNFSAFPEVVPENCKFAKKKHWRKKWKYLSQKSYHFSFFKFWYCFGKYFAILKNYVAMVFAFFLKLPSVFLHFFQLSH